MSNRLNVQQNELLKDLIYIRSLYENLINILPSFSVTDESILPYGLKPHTRSVSWLVEQVITQQTKFNRNALHITDCDFDLPDTCLHDCIVHTKDKDYFINIKAHNAGGKENKNDISAVEKLYMQYKENSDYNVIYVCIGIHFENIKIIFDKNYLEVFTAQFLPIYVNPRNDKIQAFYRHQPVFRTRDEFFKELAISSKSIHLG